LLEREVEIEEHEDAGFGIDAEKGDEPHPDGDRHVVVEEPEEPDRPDRGEWHGEEDDHRLRDRSRVHVEEDEDDEERERHDDREARLRTLEVLELSSPFQVVSGRQLDLLVDGALRFGDVAAEITPGDVYEYVPGDLAVLVVD